MAKKDCTKFGKNFDKEIKNLKKQKKAKNQI